MDINKITSISSNSSNSSNENLQNKKNNNKSINIGEEINGIKIDGKIGEFAQGSFGTCKFLSMLLSLSFTDWGREVIDEAIESDGNGGAYVTYYDFDGSADTIHLTNKELVEAKSKGGLFEQMSDTEFEIAKQTSIKYGNNSQEYNNVIDNYKKKYKCYSIGDDDVLAFEMALEKKLVKEYNKEKEIHKQKMSDLGINYVAYSNPENLLNSHYYHHFTKNGFGLLNGDKSVEYISQSKNYIFWEEQVFNPKTKKVILDFFEQKLNTEKITAFATFKSNSVIKSKKHPKQNLPAFTSKDTTEKIEKSGFLEKISTNHAYAIKELRTNNNNEKFVVMINPHDTRKEIVMPYDLFIKNCYNIEFSGNKALQNEAVNHIKDTSVVDLTTVYKASEVNRNLEVARSLFNDYLNTIETATSEQHLINTEDFFNYYNKMAENEKFDDAMYLVLNDNIENLVNKIDKMYFGWGNGERKTDFLLPIINKLAQKAEKLGKAETVKTYKQNCTKELNATYYTNEKVIIKNLKKILNIIIEAQKVD